MTAVADNFYVYLLSRPCGPELYIGKGKGDRWLRHSGRGRHPNRHLHNVIAKCKREGVEIERIKLAECLTEERAFELEKFFIKAIGREDLGAGPLVNLTDGGDGPSGYKWTPELREHHSKIRKGRTLTPEHRAAISAAMKDNPKVIAARNGGRRLGRGKGETKKFPEAHIEHLRRLAEQKPHKGFAHSDDAIGRIKEARAKQPRRISPETEFKPGGVPWNKGLEGYNPSPATQFKKGHQLSEQARTNLSAAITAVWARRKAAAAAALATTPEGDN